MAQTTTDGLDVSVGLARILAGHQIYMQDDDDASKWVKYKVTADGVDDGSYFDFTVAYHSGPANVPFQTVEFQADRPRHRRRPTGRHHRPGARQDVGHRLRRRLGDAGPDPPHPATRRPAPPTPRSSPTRT